MKRQDDIDKVIDDLFNYLITNGLNPIEVKSFIKNNIDFILEELFDLNKIYMIKNNQETYAILYVNIEDYYWSINKKGHFNKFKNKGDMDKDENLYTDYIVESLLRFTTSEKLVKVVPTIKEQSLEERVSTVKKLGLNKKGYHIQ